MRHCLPSCRLSSRGTRDDEGLDEASEVDEKRVRSPRDWSAIFLTAVRLFQVAYFTLVYLSFRGFQKSSYFRENGPWQHSPDQMHHSRRMMRWVRMQAAITLIYHTVVLVVPLLRRLLRATSRPFTNLGTVFGDGCVMVAMINTLVMLDTDHESYCHSSPSLGDFDFHSMFSFGRGGHHHDMSSHRTVCKSMDVVFGLGGLIIFTHIVTAIVTARRAKRPALTVYAKVEPASDVEQGIVAQRPDQAQQASSSATPERQHSPPPPYRSGVSEFARGPESYPERTVSPPIPRGRSSVETTSSLGIENYLVSDGWRAPEQPPEYSSRPPSLHHHAFP